MGWLGLRAPVACVRVRLHKVAHHYQPRFGGCRPGERLGRSNLKEKCRMASFLMVIRICSNSFFPTFLMNFRIGGQIIGMRIDYIDRFLPVA